MGSFLGHVLPGIAFLALGLWHLFNQMKLHYSLHQNSYTSSAWFPTSKIRYLELFLIMAGTTISISIELFIGPEKHHPFDVDGTIPSNHLRNLEHATISLFFFVYAASAVFLDSRITSYPNTPNYHYLKQQYSSLTHLVGALSFAQEFLLFYLHSTDHMGLEGQYHIFLQILSLVCSITSLMGVALPNNFLVSFVRSLALGFQGVWFIVAGNMLWTPEFLPKGCFLSDEGHHLIARCGDEEALHRAKSLVNLLFSWLLVGITVFALLSYEAFGQIYGKNVEHYSSVPKEVDELEDVELQNKKLFGESKNLLVHQREYTLI